MKRFVLCVATLTCLPASVAFGGPADYVYTPAVTYGEREIDFKTGSWKRTGEDRLSASSIGFGYGVTQHWFTEIYQKYQRTGNEGLRIDAWEWENKFQLTETGQYPVDVGFLVEFEHPKDRSEGNELRFGPLFQTEAGKFQYNGNLLFERHYGATSPQRMELGYQWQAKYRWQPQFEFGLQGFGDLGKWDRWDPSDQRSHRLGPAIFGKITLGNRQAIRYNAAWLVSASTNAPNHNLRVQLEYEF